MPKTHRVKIGNVTRNLPIIAINSEVSIALFNSIDDTEVIVQAAQELARQLPEEIDLFITPEAKSIPLAFELSRRTKIPYIVARKSKKSYMGRAIEEQVLSITTAVPQQLFIDEKDIDFIKDKKVAIIDDVISTGATVKALKKLVAKAGGEVVVLVAVFTEGDPVEWADVVCLGNLPILATHTQNTK